MKILVDCDGVLANFASTYLDILEVQTGRKHALDEITGWNFYNCVCTYAEDRLVWQYIANTPGVVKSLNAYAGVSTSLAKLRGKHKVVCVTKPQWGTNWTAERYQWLTGHGFLSNEIVFTGDKTLIPGDILVEDNPTYLQEWMTAHPESGGVLISQPWNRSAEGWWAEAKSFSDWARTLV